MSEIFLGQVYMVHIEGTQNLYYHYNSLNTNNIHFYYSIKETFQVQEVCFTAHLLFFCLFWSHLSP